MARCPECDRLVTVGYGVDIDRCTDVLGEDESAEIEVTVKALCGQCGAELGATRESYSFYPDHRCPEAGTEAYEELADELYSILEADYDPAGSDAEAFDYTAFVRLVCQGCGEAITHGKELRILRRRLEAA